MSRIVAPLVSSCHHADCGCDYASCCIICPLPRCRYEEPGGLRALLNAYRDQQITALRDEGVKVDQIAQRYSLHHRTVSRISVRSVRRQQALLTRR